MLSGCAHLRLDLAQSYIDDSARLAEVSFLREGGWEPVLREKPDYLRQSGPLRQAE